jgi:hypothetical protein
MTYNIYTAVIPGFLDKGSVMNGQVDRWIDIHIR